MRYLPRSLYLAAQKQIHGCHSASVLFKSAHSNSIKLSRVWYIYRWFRFCAQFVTQKPKYYLHFFLPVLSPCFLFNLFEATAICWHRFARLREREVCCSFLVRYRCAVRVSYTYNWQSVHHLHFTANYDHCSTVWFTIQLDRQKCARARRMCVLCCFWIYVYCFFHLLGLTNGIHIHRPHTCVQAVMRVDNNHQYFFYHLIKAMI